MRGVIKDEGANPQTVHTEFRAQSFPKYLGVPFQPLKPNHKPLTPNWQILETHPTKRLKLFSWGNVEATQSVEIWSRWMVYAGLVEPACMYTNVAIKVARRLKIIYMEGFGVHRDNKSPIYLSHLSWLIYILGHLFIVCLCLLAKPLEIFKCVFFFLQWLKELADLGFSNGNWSRWHSYNLLFQTLHRQSLHTLCLMEVRDCSSLRNMQTCSQHAHAHVCVCSSYPNWRVSTRARFHINLKESDSWNHIMNSNHGHFHNAKT